MKMRRKNRFRGFTIPELMVAMIVIGIIMTLASVEFWSVIHHFSKTSTELDSEREARTVVSAVEEQLRQASPNFQVQSTQPVQSPVFAGPSPTPVSSVTFTMPAQGTELTSADSTAVTYDTVTIQRGSVVPPGHIYPDLLLIRNNGPAEDIGRDVAYFGVTARSATWYDIDVTIAPPTRADQANDANQSYSLHSSIYVSYTNNL